MPDHDLQIDRLPSERLDELEPLWHALCLHHDAVAPAGMPPLRERADSWRRRRSDYESWLAAGGFALVARRGTALVAYAMTRLREVSPTWQVGEPAGELETLSVVPAERGRGVGEALLDAVCTELRARGASELGLAAIATNERALAFYERQGFRALAVWLQKPLGG